MFGDPNFITFDGAKLRFANSALNYFWVVNSAQVKIQGYATDRGSWIQGVAVGGPFLGSSKLVAYRRGENGDMNVRWNGQEILKTDNSKFEQSGAKLYRSRGLANMPPEGLLKSVFGKRWFASQLDTVMKMWKESITYTFKLPSKVEIYMVFCKMLGTPSVQVLVKMPPNGEHGGWCGNFNGDKGDEGRSNYMGALKQSENWFTGGSLLLMDVQRNRTDTLCKEKSLDIAATDACDHIKEEDIRSACIADICTSRQFSPALTAADEIAIMKGLGAGTSKECEPKPTKAPWKGPVR